MMIVRVAVSARNAQPIAVSSAETIVRCERVSQIIRCITILLVVRVIRKLSKIGQDRILPFPPIVPLIRRKLYSRCPLVGNKYRPEWRFPTLRANCSRIRS
jgi:hypothetical protein